jgi:DNA-binding NtrC family response regulator
VRDYFVVVEDDDAIARPVAHRLVRLGGEVVVAMTLGDAKALLAPGKRRPTGLWLDHVLPDGLGLEWLEELAREHRDPPTTIVTGEATPEIELRAYALGHALLHKPFDARCIDVFAAKSAAAREMGGRAEQLLTRLAAEHGFRSCDMHILRLFLLRIGRKLWPDALGISEHKLKHRISEMLVATGKNSLEELMDPLLAALARGDEEPALAGTPDSAKW